jgi:hypothetical protein
MNASHNLTRWIDTWWPLLLILFGTIFVTCLVSFRPYY